MARFRDPLKPTKDKVTRVEAALQKVMDSTLRDIFKCLKFLQNFMGKLTSEVRKINDLIGKAIADLVTKTGRSLVRNIEAAFSQSEAAQEVARSVLRVLNDKGERSEILKALQHHLKNLMQDLKNVLGNLKRAVSDIDALIPAISHIESKKVVLQVVFPWVREITGGSAYIRKAKNLAKQAKAEIRDAIKETTAAHNIVSKA